MNLKNKLIEKVSQIDELEGEMPNSLWVTIVACANTGNKELVTEYFRHIVRGVKEEVIQIIKETEL